MPLHPALAPGRVAVITGAASGIGFAAAMRLASLGMKVCLADSDSERLEKAAKAVGQNGDVMFVATDVSNAGDVERLRDAVYASYGEVAFLMNNAGTGSGGGLLGQRADWQKTLGVNLWGVIHGIQAFVPKMLAQGTDCAVVNTGSKQGITCPPGNTAYNVSKAGVKTVTEALAHELRNMDGCRISAHLLIPGFTFTGMTQGGGAKPDAAWLPEQVIDFMLDAMGAGDFYILCPDNSVTRRMDELRMRWAMDDIILNRPALSRWHKDYEAKFAEYMKSGLIVPDGGA